MPENVLWIVAHVVQCSCVPCAWSQAFSRDEASWDVSVTTEQIHANALKELSSIFLPFPLGFGYR